ncbi:MAG: hypothetical protein ACQKBU_10675 [Verrucomicrobiales bacterium]
MALPDRLHPLPVPPVPEDEEKVTEMDAFVSDEAVRQVLLGAGSGDQTGESDTILGDETGFLGRSDLLPGWPLDCERSPGVTPGRDSVEEKVFPELRSRQAAPPIPRVRMENRYVGPPRNRGKWILAWIAVCMLLLVVAWSFGWIGFGSEAPGEESMEVPGIDSSSP